MEQAVAKVEVIELTAPAAPFEDVDVQQWARCVFPPAGRHRVPQTVRTSALAARGVGGASTFYWWMLAAAMVALVLA